jgi:enamine deaminase RidA (YjgF/YER057c/UK114 family)
MSNNLKTHSWPKNHWGWPVELSHQHGVRRGGFIYTGGQADLNRHGDVVNPDDLSTQTINVLQFVDDILADFGSTLDNLLKLVIYFTGELSDEALILDLIASRLTLNHRPVVSTICLPALCYPGMRIELEGIAVDASEAEIAAPHFIRNDKLCQLHPHYSHLVVFNSLIMTSDFSSIDSAGTVQAPNDLTKQTSIMMEQLCTALKLTDVTCGDVLKLNVFYEGDGTAENWEKPAKFRADYFSDPGPAATGIAVTRFANPALKTKISVTARVAQTDAQTTQYAWPENHWNWSSPLPYKHGNRHGNFIHLGGQVALDSGANVLHPDDIVVQTKIALANINTVLHDLGATMDDIVKVTTFYEGSASADELHKNLMIRSNAFTTPGPATSGIPVPHLVYKHMMIEIEIIAIARTSAP